MEDGRAANRLQGRQSQRSIHIPAGVFTVEIVHLMGCGNWWFIVRAGTLVLVTTTP